MNKIIINNCYGGATLSLRAMKRVCKAKNIEYRVIKEDRYNYLETIDGVYITIHDFERHDKDIVNVVEQLGKAASGSYSDLIVVEIEGNKYKIEEYDGVENIVEPEAIEWKVII